MLSAAAWRGSHVLLFALAHESTDDAQVEGRVSPVLPRVNGYVAQVLVADNERVAAGQAVLVIDSAELDLKAANARAALASARAALEISEATLASVRATAHVAAANVGAVRVAQAKAASDLARDDQLVRTGIIAEQQGTDSRAAADAAAAQLEAVRLQAAAAAKQIDVAEAQVGAARAQVAERVADVDYAQLQRSYATVVAPIAGLVSHKNVELGQYVQAGQTLLSIAGDTDLWLVANYKETQVAQMHVGQAVEFTVDGYPGLQLHGRVDSIAGATGARFALLPPDNASGNFVKVTQRLPVKIAIDRAAAHAPVLRPGMSVDVAVRTKG
ncbi:MAG: secretion protein HlyD [Verrucomicrobia bacterium]|nr:secretion protein HlyD [Verrucomicrobiota bacterium]